MKTWKADAALLLNTLIWGATFVLVKDALSDMSPLVFLAFRFLLAGSVLLLIYGRKLRRAALLPGLIAGTFLFFGYLFQTTGLQYTTPSKSAFYTSLSIPLVPLLSSLVYRSAPRWIEVAGIVVASSGMLLLTTEGSRVVWDRGSLFGLLCAVAFAGHIVALGYFSGRFHFETLATVQVLVAAICAGLSFPFLETPRIHWTSAAAVAIAVTALLATALAFTIQAWAQQHTSATRTAVIYTLEPVWAWVTSWVVTGETLSRPALTGGFLILAGVLLVELKRDPANEHRKVRAISPEV